MDKTRFIFLILLIVVLIIITIYVVKNKKRKTKDSLSSDRQLVASSNQASISDLSNNALDPFSYTLVLDPRLEAVKKRIFPLQIKDVVLETFEKEPHYRPLLDGLKHYLRAPTQEELVFLLKYKKFMARSDVYSMCGPREIEQMYVLLLNIVANQVPGDIVETGVWKGGMGMWMKAVLNHFSLDGKDALGPTRQLWLFDAFGEFPQPEKHLLADGEEIPTHEKDLSVHALTKIMYDKPVIAENVRSNFQNLGLLDERVKLVKGLFSKTIPAALSRIQKLAILRIDNDYYDSVLFVLENLYDLLSPGGFVVIDDYNNPVLGCQDAVHHFRSKYQITSPIIDRYGGSVYWQV